MWIAEMKRKVKRLEMVESREEAKSIDKEAGDHIATLRKLTAGLQRHGIEFDFSIVDGLKLSAEGALPLAVEFLRLKIERWRAEG